MTNVSALPFQRKFLMIWGITGAVLGLIVGVGVMISIMTDSTTKMQAQDIWIGILFFPLLAAVIWSIFGGFGLAIDAGSNHKWKFNEIRYPQWKWYCYPIFGYFGSLIFLFTFVFNIMKAFSGKK